MATLGLILLALGGLIALITGVMILIKAFQTSVLWGLGSIFIPLVSLVFVIKHWEQTKKPFLIGLIAIPLYMIGGFLSVQGAQA